MLFMYMLSYNINNQIDIFLKLCKDVTYKTYKMLIPWNREREISHETDLRNTCRSPEGEEEGCILSPGTLKKELIKTLLISHLIPILSQIIISIINCIFPPVNLKLRQIN